VQAVAARSGLPTFANLRTVLGDAVDAPPDTEAEDLPC